MEHLSPAISIHITPYTHIYIFRLKVFVRVYLAMRLLYVMNATINGRHFIFCFAISVPLVHTRAQFLYDYDVAFVCEWYYMVIK